MAKPAGMQKASLGWKAKGLRVALVPTLGALHEGHLALIRRAAGLADRVVVSLYVNPTQFDSGQDFRRYPRRPGEDAALARRAGADVLFRPTRLYERDASTWVEEVTCSRGRCGDFRKGHFRGVTTVVAKLLLLVQPDLILLGDKDRQQCEVIERMVRDLYFPVRVIRHPTVRESDGLPWSSRNLRLDRVSRHRAGQWSGILKKAAAAGPGAALRQYHRDLRELRQVRGEYAAIVDGHLQAAVRIGGIRLVDHRPCRRGR